MRFEYLEYLLEIDRCRSLSKAAKKLYVTQPALSAAISALELEFGFPLFWRSNTGMTPTNNGQRIIADARTIVGLYREWFSLPTAEDEVRGSICVAANPAVCKTFMLNILGEVRRLHPKLDVTVSEIMIRDMLTHMKDHQSNVGIMAYPEKLVDGAEAELRAAGFHTARLHCEKMKCILSAGHPLAHKSTLTQEDLKRLAFATYIDNGDPITTQIMDIIPPSCTRYRVGSDEMIRNMVAMNMAATIGPEISGQSMQYEGENTFRFLDVEGYDDTSVYFVITPPEAQMSPAERKFVDVVHAVFREYSACVD